MGMVAVIMVYLKSTLITGAPEVLTLSMMNVMLLVQALWIARRIPIVLTKYTENKDIMLGMDTNTTNQNVILTRSTANLTTRSNDHIPIMKLVNKSNSL